MPVLNEEAGDPPDQHGRAEAPGRTASGQILCSAIHLEVPGSPLRCPEPPSSGRILVHR